MRKTLLLSAMLFVTACAGSRPIVTIPPARCVSLVPADWAQGVEATPVPDNAPGLAEWIGKPLTQAVAAALVAPWASAYVGMDAQLEKANGRTADTVTIVGECEKMVNAARPD